MTESNIKVPEGPKLWGPTITVGNTIIDFGPLILVLSIIFIVFLSQFILLRQKFKKKQMYLKSGNYSEAVKIGEYLLKVYTKNSKRILSQKRLQAILNTIDNLNLSLAVSYFALSEEEKFLSTIQNVNQNLDIKEFWLALYSLQKDDFEQFKVHADNISDSDEYKKSKAYLEAYSTFKQGQTELAKELMSSIFDSLENPFLRDLAKTVVNKN